MVWPAVIAAGAAIGGALLNKSSVSSNPEQRLEEYRRDDKYLRRRVIDAKAAGLHPLFALGTSASSSPSFMGASSGSFAGEGLARAGEHIAEGMRADTRQKRTTRLDAVSAQIHNLRLQKMTKEIQLDDMEIMKRASDLKYAEQRHLYWGNPGGTGGGLESMTYPYGTKEGPPLNMRPLTAEGRRSIPAFMEMAGPAGRRMIRNPDIGDELSEVDTMVRPWYDYAKSFYNKSRFRPTMKNPKSFYYYWKNYYKRRKK